MPSPSPPSGISRARVPPSNASVQMETIPEDQAGAHNAANKPGIAITAPSWKTRRRFWLRYRVASKEDDDQFLRTRRDDLDNAILFATLFAGLAATIGAMIVDDFDADPDAANQLLLQNIQLILLSMATGSPPPQIQSLPVWNGPGPFVTWVQSVLYASLACSLLVALGAVLGKQWINRYDTFAERGSEEDLCIQRQRKYDALRDWHFHTMLEGLFILLQLSLLLFSLALSAVIYQKQHVVGGVLITMHGIGAVLYVVGIVWSLEYPESPYATAVSEEIKELLLAANRIAALLYRRIFVLVRWTSVMWGLVRRFFKSIFSRAMVPSWMRYGWRRLRGIHQDSTYDEESPELPLPQAGPSDGQDATDSEESLPSTYTDLAFTPTLPDRSAVAATLWALKTCTDPDIRQDIYHFMPHVNWPSEAIRDHFSTGILDILLAKLKECLEPDADGHLQLRDSRVDDALAHSASFLLVYWELRALTPPEAMSWSKKVFQDPGHWNMADAFQPEQIRRIIGKDWSEDIQMLHLVYLSLGPHFKEQYYSDKLIGYISDDPRSDHSEPALDSLVARTLFYLVQASDLDDWSRLQRVGLLDELGHAFTEARSEEARWIVVMAFAMMAGYPLQSDLESLTLKRIHEVEGEKAVQFVLGQLKHVLYSLAGHTAADELSQGMGAMLKMDQDNRGGGWPKLLTRFSEALQTATVGPATLRLPNLFPHYLELCQATFSNLIHPDDFDFDFSPRSPWSKRVWFAVRALQLAELPIPDPFAAPEAVESFPPQWKTTTEPQRLEWLAEFLKALPHLSASRNTGELESLLQATAKAFLLLSQTQDMGPTWKSILPPAFEWAMQIQNAYLEVSKHTGRHLSQLQWSTLFLVYSLAKRGSIVLTLPGIQNFVVKQVAYPIRKSLANKKNVQHLFLRDRLFVHILFTLSHGDQDDDDGQSTLGQSWLDDPENRGYVRQWVLIIKRWMIHPAPYILDIASRPGALMISSMLQGESFLEPKETYWSDDFYNVLQVRMVAIWWNWWDVLLGSENKERLATTTLDFLTKMETRTAVDIEWHINAILRLIGHLQVSDEEVTSPETGLIEQLRMKLECMSRRIREHKAQSLFGMSQNRPDSQASQRFRPRMRERRVSGRNQRLVGRGHRRRDSRTDEPRTQIESFSATPGTSGTNQIEP
ncbi:hypothetical protein BXZ70DRAFT_202285 [Cristinia sonorae]|uniref:DUF6535 domain-containing protein n=1 Tax=Cristinia sonorae TaxID=1940300 RepID=A0A8K0XPL9_9AGAR|nr:hypothetical protein BXZ70DRAFT_202285 [Cristinia sonorae]